MVSLTIFHCGTYLRDYSLSFENYADYQYTRRVHAIEHWAGMTYFRNDWERQSCGIHGLLPLDIAALLERLDGKVPILQQLVTGLSLSYVVLLPSSLSIMYPDYYGWLSELVEYLTRYLALEQKLITFLGSRQIKVWEILVAHSHHLQQRLEWRKTDWLPVT